MKKTLSILFLSISSVFYAQENPVQYYDTLFYSAGYSVPCTINYIENKKVHFYKTTKKGIQTKSFVSFNSLDYYVDYNSTGTSLLERNNLIVNTSDTSLFSYVSVVDTVMVPRSLLSFNPLSILGLGFSLDYMYRFGKEKTLAFNVPMRVITFYGAFFVFQTGLGFKFIPFNSEKASITMGANASVYLTGDGMYLGFPVTIGVIRNITNLLTINVYGGVGPYTNMEGDRFGAVIPDFHFGLGFKFGQYFETTHKYGKKVAK